MKINKQCGFYIKVYKTLVDILEFSSRLIYITLAKSITY